ncbi:MAG: PAS domain S-box protein [Flavobacterium sp.]|uniref:PAS domain S-box protein n=1 Tax=Flavobacterium sp. TaxID=239 RepID=UPI00391AEE60
MKWRLQFNLAVAAFGTALALLVFINVLLFVSLDKNTQQDRYVVHTYRVLKTSNALFSAIKDAETAQRGYILTKDTSFLTPYQHSIAAKNRLLVQLDKLIKDNKVQQQRLKHIKSLIHQKYRFIEKSLSTLHQSGSDQTIDLVNKGEGKMIMDQLRLAFQKFNTHENRLLKQRTYEAQKSVNTLKFTLVYSVLISILIFAITFYKLFQKIKVQHQQEEALFVQNEWYRQTMYSLGDGVITTDVNGNITFINRSGLHITGWIFKDAVGQPIETVFNIVNPDNPEKNSNPALMAMKENKIVFLAKNTQLIQKNGNTIYIDDSGAPIHDREGHIIGSVLIFRDITEKRKTEEKLNLIYNQSLDMIGVANKEGYFISINPAVTKILGYTQEEFLARSYFDFIHPDDIERTDNEKHTLFENIDTLDFVNRYRSKDGTYKWIEWNVTMVDDLMYAMGRDITERKKAYEMIAETHKKFYQVLESSPVAIIITEIETRKIIYANDSFCLLSGFDQKSLVGYNAIQLGAIKPEEAEKILKNIKEEGGHKRDIESQLKRLDGTLIDVLFSVESIEIEGKMCYIGTFIDITERKKSETNTLRMNLELEKRVKKRTAQIEKQKQFTDEILNKIPTEIAVYDSFEKYLYVNPKGIESEEIRDWVIGKTDFDLCKLKGLDPALAEKRHWSFQNIHKNESVEWIDEITQEDGSTKYMLRILHPLDKKKKFILTGYDITQLKNAEKEKTEYIKSLEEMMFMTSHKVRLPIANIIGIAGLLEYDLNKEELAKIMDNVKDSVTALDTFTRELTMFIHNVKKKL